MPIDSKVIVSVRVLIRVPIRIIQEEFMYKGISYKRVWTRFRDTPRPPKAVQESGPRSNRGVFTLGLQEGRGRQVSLLQEGKRAV